MIPKYRDITKLKVDSKDVNNPSFCLFLGETPT